ncbi:MAG: alkyl sulfatase dimerization domain-containing protein [Desulfatibacillaceae bacterium]
MPRKKSRLKTVFAAVAILLVVAVAAAAVFLYKSRPHREAAPVPVGANKHLAEHGKQFERGVVQVADNMHVAIGYGISNSILIEGDEGVIVVDTMTTNEEAAEVLAEFRKITDKPIRALIYTHAHPDHVFGSTVFAKEDNPDVYAHETNADFVKHLVTEVGPIISSRSMRMYGNYLEEDAVLNVGIGPFVGTREGSTLGYVTPNRTFRDRMSAEVAGIKFDLVHTGGETNDQLFVWLPEQKILIPGDNFYWTFPNLYTIRGTPFRSLKKWYKAIDTMRELPAELMVPCHTRPIEGADRIREILTNYRDAIQYCHDQTIRCMNMGMHPDEIAEVVRLPPHLAEAPYLQPFYGKVPWSVRSVFAGNLGWYSGDSADLHPLNRVEEARLMERLAGGVDNLAKQAEELLAEGGLQAALEVTGHVLRLAPDNERAKNVRVQALLKMGEAAQNPNARHYYLTEAVEIRDGFVSKMLHKPTDELLAAFDLWSYFEALGVNLDPEASSDVNQEVGMVFDDENEAFTIHVRWGVAEMRRHTPEEVMAMDLPVIVKADAAAWKGMLAQIRKPAKTLAGFEYVNGNAADFALFMKLFEPPPMKRPWEAWQNVEDMAGEVEARGA